MDKIERNMDQPSNLKLYRKLLASIQTRISDLSALFLLETVIESNSLARQPAYFRLENPELFVKKRSVYEFAFIDDAGRMVCHADSLTETTRRV